MPADKVVKDKPNHIFLESTIPKRYSPITALINKNKPTNADSIIKNKLIGFAPGRAFGQLKPF